jgi:hypothetical protein
MKVKTSELTGHALDWAVCEAAGMLKAYTQFRSGKNFLKVWGVAANTHLHPSTDWAQGGPIIERENIGLVCQQPESIQRCAYRQTAEGEVFYHYGPTPLTAAMRCYVASELGDEVDVPDELGS